jgi:hypothetical protein
MKTTIEDLKEIQTIIENVCPHSAYDYAINVAVQTLELMPELLNQIDNQIDVALETGIVDWLDEAKRTIQKAKELMGE